MATNLKIGDKVRFLNDIGGGTVIKLIDSKNVSVLDENGFEIPTAIRECIKIDEPETQATGQQPSPTSSSVFQKDEDEDNSYYAFEDKSNPQANKTSVFLAFVPHPSKPSTFDVYFINDSNYHLYFTLLSKADKDSFNLISRGEIECNTKLFIDHLHIDKIDRFQHLAIQLLPFKPKSAFQLKSALQNHIKVNLTRFHKASAFVSSDFFNEKALIIPFIEDDIPAYSIGDDSLGNIHKNLSSPKQKSPKTQYPKSNTNDNTVVIDLHFHEISEESDDKTIDPLDILTRQVNHAIEQVSLHSKTKGQKIVLIHGVGAGVLRAEVLKALKREFPKYTTQDASFQEYGYGATLVTVR